MLIDTHCHLDARKFDDDRDQVVDRAAHAGVRVIVIPAVSPENLSTVAALAASRPSLVYALGIHPLFVNNLPDNWLELLTESLKRHQDDPQLVAIGEIGLDYFVPGIDPQLQERVYRSQLELAAQFDLPVLLHVRRSQDRLLKYLRQVSVPGGIAHAFNGSVQQAEQFIAHGFALGFGGAMTFERARQIRRLAAGVAAQSYVLETDAPDIPPEWINHQRNEPAQLARIAEVMAGLRETPLAQTVAQSAANARRVLPRLDAWLQKQQSQTAQITLPGR